MIIDIENIIKRKAPEMNNNFIESKKILEKLLKRHEISWQKLFNELPELHMPGFQAAIFYISKMDGVGNNSSDLDVYIICEHKTVESKIYKIKNLVLDVEFWTISDLNNCIQKNIIEQDFNREDLKTLHRLKIGYKLNENEKHFNLLMSKYDDEQLCNIVKEKNLLFASSTIDDSLKMLENENLSCALTCANKVFEYSLVAYCAHNGVANINEKWIPFIIEKTNAFSDNDIMESYLQYYIFKEINRDNIETYIKELIYISQDILFKIALT